MPTAHATNRIETVGGVSVPANEWDNRGNLTWIPAFQVQAVPLVQQREKRLTFSPEDRLMETVAIPDSPPDPSITWRYAYDTAGERVLAWRKDEYWKTYEARFTLRDEGGTVLSDWILIPDHDDPSQSYFDQARDYLYAGSRMVAQIDWGTEPVRRFAAVDHLGSTRYLLSENPSSGSWTGEAMEFYPFGRTKVGGSTPDTKHLFTGHERDFGLDLSELDYMHARYYSPNLGDSCQLTRESEGIGSPELESVFLCKEQPVSCY